MNKENNSFLDNHETQISQVFFCNQFIILCNKILEQLKNILNSEANLSRAKKLIDLSILLKKLKSPLYKKLLFSHKLENVSNSKHLLLICSVIYEEIFNTTLNSSQLPLRENIQSLEDIFYNNTNKINKIVSLGINVTNNSCIIIRAGKGLHSYINTNLFDLFPLIFKQYQIKLFMDNILEGFEIKEKETYNNTNINSLSKFSTKNKSSSLKGLNNNKNKKGFIEIELILSQNIENKIYYKLLTLKIAPLYNNNVNPYFIFLDGIYYPHKSTLITMKDLQQNKKENEILIAVSEPELYKNNEIYSFGFKKYYSLIINQDLVISKISSFKISDKLYNIYQIDIKDENKKKIEKKISKINFNEEELPNTLTKTKKSDKIQLMEDNASVASHQTGSNNSGGISNLNIRNKKGDNIYEYERLYKIKIINIILILIAIIIVILEYIILNFLKKINYNGYISLLQFNELYKLYFQLFSSIFSVSCIDNLGDCLKIIDLFINKYMINNNEEEDYFDFHELFVSQNILLAEKIMEKRNNLVNIHKYIGNKNYNKLFGKKINFYRLTQSVINKNYKYNITSVNMEFS